MKRLTTLLSLLLITLSAVSCKLDRGTILDLSFASLFQRNAADITLFSLNGVVGTINGTDINLTMPCNATLTDLKAVFVTDPVDALVTVNAVEQVNGETSNDFTNPVEYTVTSKKGRIKTYTVTAFIANANEKSITHFWIDGMEATIIGTGISITLPYGTDPSNLVAAFNTTGSEVTIGSIIQQSGITPNDFTTQKIYTVTACNGTTRDYTVNVTVALNPAKDITQFTILGIDGTIGPNAIALTVPYGTGLASLTPAIVITGASVSPASGEANDFTDPVTYTVTAADGSTKQYTVTVIEALNPAKDILQFTILGIDGSVGANTVALTVPYGTDVTSLTPTIMHTGESVSPGSGAPQDFTDPVEYTVTAADGTTKQYTVTIDVALNPAKDITQFTILGIDGDISTNTIALTVPYGTDVESLAPTIVITGASVSPASGLAQDFTDVVVYTVTAADSSTKQYTVTVTEAPSDAKEITQFMILGINGAIEANAVALTVPYGTDVESLAPAITHTGASVSPASGVAQDFTDPVVYTVHAADGSEKEYTVTVTVALNPAKDINGFVILGIEGSIGINTITLTVPYGTDLADLTPTITHTGASIYPASDVSHDFTNPVVYTVTAADASEKEYTVTVTEAGSPDKEITLFTILGIDADIGEETIALTVPYGTNVTSLMPSIDYTGASVSPASGVPQNFSSPVVYTVTAADSSTRQYTVTVTVAANPAKDITAFRIFGISGTIGADTITLTVPQGTDVTGLTPTITHTGASIDPGSDIPTDFTNPVVYTVTAADESEKEYTVTVTVSSDFLLPGTYAAGYYHNGTKHIACLWNISVAPPYRVDLEASESTAVSAAVSGGTVYVAGTFNSGACFWEISGGTAVRTDLDSTGDIIVADSLISGDYLYISGTNDLNGDSQACYWKVDLDTGAHEMISLSGGTGSRAYEMIESGGIIYIAGTAQNLPYSGISPCFWMVDSGGGDTQHFVYNSTSYGRTVMIDTLSNIVIGGWYVYNVPYTQAESWTYSGTPVSAVELPPVMTTPDSSIVSASLNISGDLYFVGQQIGTACYWLNDAEYDLSGSAVSNAYGITYHDTDIYITGYNSADADVTYSTACVWKKTGAVVTRTDLTTSATGEAAAWDVFVKD